MRLQIKLASVIHCG